MSSLRHAATCTLRISSAVSGATTAARAHFCRRGLARRTGRSGAPSSGSATGNPPHSARTSRAAASNSLRSLAASALYPLPPARAFAACQPAHEASAHSLPANSLGTSDAMPEACSSALAPASAASSAYASPARSLLARQEAFQQRYLRHSESSLGTSAASFAACSSYATLALRASLPCPARSLAACHPAFHANHLHASAMGAGSMGVPRQSGGRRLCSRCTSRLAASNSRRACAAAMSLALVNAPVGSSTVASASVAKRAFAACEAADVATLITPSARAAGSRLRMASARASNFFCSLAHAARSASAPRSGLPSFLLVVPPLPNAARRRA